MSVCLLTVFVSTAGSLVLAKFVSEESETMNQAAFLQARLAMLAEQFLAVTDTGIDALSQRQAAIRSVDDLLMGQSFERLRSSDPQYPPTVVFARIVSTWRDSLKPQLLHRATDVRNDAGKQKSISYPKDELQVRLVSAVNSLTGQIQDLIRVLQQDILLKQETVLWLQFACMGVALIGFILGIYYSHEALVIRLGRLLGRFQHEGTRTPESVASGDEVQQITRVVEALSAKLDALEGDTLGTHGLQCLELIYDVDKLLSDSQLTEAIFLRVLKRIETTLGVKSSAVHLVSEGIGANRDIGPTIFTGSEAPALLKVKTFDDLSGSPSISYYESLEHGDIGRPARLAALITPIRERDNILGLLILEVDENFQFEDWHMQLASAVSRQIAAAIGAVNIAHEMRRIALFQERAAIARELHDSIAQSLSFMKIQITRLQSILNFRRSPEEAELVIGELREGLNSAYRKLRELLTTFRVNVSVGGLRAGLEETIEEFRARSGLTFTLENRLGDCKLSSNEEIHTLQVIREALSNIVRHAHANNAVVTLEYDLNKYVTVTVDDDGQGCGAVADRRYHHGMIIMEDRVNSLGGTLKVEAINGGGTRVRFRFTPASIGSRELLAYKN
jgi:two-component system nitrate/nitrite sensor histidine kinase NarX